MSQLEKESIDRALFGVAANLSDLFTEFAYAPRQIERANGKIVRQFHSFPEGMHFMSTSATASVPGIDTSFQTFVKRGLALCARPAENVRRAAQARCIGGLSSFELIYWKATGHVLVLARDKAMIANPWLAFVPLSGIPEIKPEAEKTK